MSSDNNEKFLSCVNRPLFHPFRVVLRRFGNSRVSEEGDPPWTLPVILN